MEEKKQKGVMILISAIPFFIGTILVEMIFAIFLKSSRPMGVDFTIASIIAIFIGLYGAFKEDKPTLAKVFKYVGLALSILGGLLNALFYLDTSNKAYFIRILWTVTLCFQVITYDYVADFLKKFGNTFVEMLAPLINFLLLTILGIPFAVLGELVWVFIGTWFPFLIMVVVCVLYIKKRRESGGGSSSSGKRGHHSSSYSTKEPSSTHPLRMRHPRDPEDE